MKKAILFFSCLVINFSCTKKDVFDVQPGFLGAIQSANTYGGSANESLFAVKNTEDGGYIAVGHTQSNDGSIVDKTDQSYDVWVIRFSADDQILWNKTFGGRDDDRGRAILTLSDGTFIVSGFSRSRDGDLTSNAGNYDFWVFKIDANGNLLWEKSFGFSGADQAYTLFETSDGDILVGGTLDVTASGGAGNSKPESRHAGGDYWLIKMDANGNTIWTRYFGGLFTDTLFGIQETTDSAYILVGSSDSEDTNVSNNLGSYDYWIVKVSSDGSLVWEKNFGGEQIDEAFSITNSQDGHFLIVGNSRSFDQNVSQNNGSSDIWIVKMDADGQLLLEKNYGGTSFEEAKQIIPSLYGGYYIAGSSRSADIDVSQNNGNKDGWILKIDEQGKLFWAQSIGGSQLEELNGITELADGTVIAVGEAWSADFDIKENRGFSDALILKIQ